jgi:SepF-like predicted cell division protein (DUF552 family)
MEIKIENQKLAPAINLLYGLSLKGKQSRHRSKFVRMLQEKFNEFIEDEKQLRKEECNLDEKGEPKTFIKNGVKTLDVKDLSHFEKVKNELYKEKVVIAGAEKETAMQTVHKVLDSLDKELSNQDADAYDYLLDQFEAADEAKKESAK